MNKAYRIFAYFAFVSLPVIALGQNADTKSNPVHKKKTKKHVSSAIKKENDSAIKKEQVRRILEEKTQNNRWKNKIILNEPKK